METFFEFFSFTNPNVNFVIVGTTLLSASSAIVGSYTFLQKKALIGDAVSHAILPGICLAFLLTGTKNPAYLILGATATGWLSLVFINWINAHSKLKEDTAIGLTLSVFFGAGIFLLTIIQQSGNASQSGLDQFLFGNTAALVGRDLYYFGTIALILLLTTALLFKEFKLIIFDLEQAKAMGLPVKRLQLVLTTLTVLAVVAGIQAVGVVLMAAMLITPAAAARFWTNKLVTMMILAGIIGILSGISGAYISFLSSAMPTGPWIVVVASGIAFFSFFASPHKGIIAKLMRQAAIRQKILNENILKAFYHLGEKDGRFYVDRTVDEVRHSRMFNPRQLKKGLKGLTFQGFVKNTNGHWNLTKAGFEKGKRIVKLHRLWELYLSEYMNIAQDHVHDDAETIEHILTPEIEEKLMQKLNYPTEDPHHSVIP
jgi:manganese/zinc/iron transport system permease protein